MQLAILFALLSLIFAGINDVVFKRYAGKERSRGLYVLGIGVVWTALQAVIFAAQGVSLRLDQNTILFGLTAGLFLTIANILLIESLTHTDVSFGSTIYRLNTVGVVIFSYLFLSEPFGILKSWGILAGVIGVLLLYQKRSGPQRTAFPAFFLVAVVASLSRASYSVTAKAAIILDADPSTMLLLISSCWIVGGACYAVVRERRFRLTKKKIFYILLSGILVCLIVNFLMLAIEHGEASIVIPVANMSFVIALFLSAILKMETLSKRKLFGVFCAVLSIILLSQA